MVLFQNCVRQLRSPTKIAANKGRKVLKFRKFDEKGEITPKWVMGFTSKLQGV
jgi:hypothetical protein